MKKVISLLLVIVLCFGLCACNTAEDNGGSAGTTEGTNLEITGTDTTTGTESTEGDPTETGSAESSEAATDATEEAAQVTEGTAEAPTEAPVTSGDGEITYILNTNSKKYHDPDCGSVKKMSEKNKQETTLSKEELEAMGYTACGTCKP